MPTNPANTAYRRRNLALLLTSNVVSGFAQGITILAIPWTLTAASETWLPGIPNDRLKYVLVGGAQLLAVGWGLVAGTLVDRYNRKYLFVGINIAGGVVLGSWGWLGLAEGALPFAALATVLLATLFIFVVHYPNLYAFVQELFRPESYAGVNSAIEIQGQFTNAVGMAIGGILLSGTEASNLPGWLHFTAWTLPEIFVLNACTYGVAVVLLSLIRYEMGPRPNEPDGILQRVRIGLRFLRQRPPLVVFGLTSYAIFFGVLVFYPGLMPSYVHHVLGMDLQTGAQYAGYTEMGHALGALAVGVVGFLRQAWFRPENPTRAVLWLLLLAALAWGTMAAHPGLGALLLGAATIGATNSAARIVRLTYILRSVPNYVIGRVNSVFSIANGLARSLFLLLVVPVALQRLPPAVSVRLGLAVVALVLVGAAGLLLVYRKPLARSLHDLVSHPT